MMISAYPACLTSLVILSTVQLDVFDGEVPTEGNLQANDILLVSYQIHVCAETMCGKC